LSIWSRSGWAGFVVSVKSYTFVSGW
jgi:hypothetical protein